MMLRRYGNRLQSVRPHFDVLALTEIGFRRDHEMVVNAADFEERYQRVAMHELTADANGAVQRDVEQELLDDLQQQLESIERDAGSGAVLVLENVGTVDAPKTRGRQRTEVVRDENRYHFSYTIEPPLQIGVYRRRSES
jgi:hypothetical protein